MSRYRSRRTLGGVTVDHDQVDREELTIDNPRSIEVDHLLPLPLQDLCLLALINELDSYPVELLASLPHWLRHRLLYSIPALDLCRLDHTPIARGMDVDGELWDPRLQARKKPQQRVYLRVQCRGGRNIQAPTSSGTQPVTFQSLFHLNVGPESGNHQAPLSRFQYGAPQVSPYLMNEVKTAVSGLKEELSTKLASAREKCLSKIASDILSCSPGLNIRNELISIPGEHVLLDLTVASRCQTVSHRHSYSVWKKQATALVMQPVGQPPLPIRFGCRRRRIPPWPSHYDAYVVLTPHRLLSVNDKSDTLQLLSLLTDVCGIQPSSVNLHINKLSQPILDSLYTARFTVDSSLKFSSSSTTYISIVNNLLRRVVILRLQCDRYCHIGVMIGMIEAATAEGKDCQLKHLFCTLPDLYIEVIQSFASVFSLQNFHQLNLDLDEVYLLTFSKLLQGFLTAPCSHSQQLTIHTKRSIKFPNAFDTRQLAALDIGGASVPQCAIQHKMLCLSSQNESTGVLYLLLQLPTIRLNEIMLVNLNDHYQYLHLCALHPDLQVMKLVIHVDRMMNHAFLNTARGDLVSLLQMPTLQEVSISGHWGHHKEVKVGLMQGLHQQSSSHLHPLRKITLDVESGGYSTEEYQGLWDAIFSTPQLEKLEIVLGEGFVNMTKQLDFMYVINESWIQSATKRRLKSVLLKTPKTSERDVKLLSNFAQNYSFLS